MVWSVWRAGSCIFRAHEHGFAQGKVRHYRSNSQQKKYYDKVSAQVGLASAEEETGQGDIDSGKSR